MEVFAEENKNQKIEIDESYFSHIDNKQIWVIGLINTQTKEFRLIPSFKRDSATIKKIVEKFIKRGNIIITDSWAAYDWIGLVYQIQCILI